MRLLLSAPCGAPRFVGEQLLAAARRLGHDTSLFDHPASRDPTLELPAAALRHEAEVVLLVEVEREDPATIEVVRSRGARVMVWVASAPESSPAWARARRTWIAGAADRLFVTDPDALTSGLDRRGLDRRGRPARTIGRGFDPETLGITSPRDAAAPTEGPRILTALRATDDPLRLPSRPAGGELVGIGEGAAFSRGTKLAALAEPGRFGALVAGRAYIAGGRAVGGGPPSVFDDVAAARAAGGRVERWAAHGQSPDQGDVDAPAAAPTTFEQLLRVMLDDNGESE